MKSGARFCVEELRHVEQNQERGQLERAERDVIVVDARLALRQVARDGAQRVLGGAVVRSAQLGPAAQNTTSTSTTAQRQTGQELLSKGPESSPKTSVCAQRSRVLIVMWLKLVKLFT